MDLLIITIFNMVLKCYPISRKQDPTRQKIFNMSSKMFKRRFFEISKMFKNILEFFRAVCCVKSKTSKRNKITNLGYYYVITIENYCFSVVIECP